MKGKRSVVINGEEIRIRSRLSDGNGTAYVVSGITEYGSIIASRLITKEDYEISGFYIDEEDE